MKRMQVGLVGAVIPALMLLAAVRGGELVIDAPEKPAVTAKDIKAIKETLKAYAAALRTGDKQKVVAFYPAKNDEERKYAAIFAETDLAVEGFATLIQKQFGKEKWKTIAPLMGWIDEERLDKLQVRRDEDEDVSVGGVLVDLYPDAKEGPDDRWFSSIVMMPSKTGWTMGNIGNETREGKVDLRRWSRDVQAELAELTKAITEGKYKTWEEAAKAVRRLVKETSDNAGGGMSTEAPVEQNPPE